MPHAVLDETATMQSRLKRSGKGISNAKQLSVVAGQYNEISTLFHQSQLSASLASALRNKLSASPIPITRAVSLGLGSFTERSKDQARRLKQLSMFMGAVEHVHAYYQSTTKDNAFSVKLELFAQDPTFTKADTAFLNALGIKVLRTPSPSEMGDAQSVIDERTLVYSPFLTIEAYEALLSTCAVNMLLGDDVLALKRKFDKNTSDHRRVEVMSKTNATLSHSARRAITGGGFWDVEGDRPFPMALYWRQDLVDRVSKL